MSVSLFASLLTYLHRSRNTNVTTMLGLMLAPDLKKTTVNLDPDKEEEKPSDHWNAAQTSPEVLKLFFCGSLIGSQSYDFVVM